MGRSSRVGLAAVMCGVAVLACASGPGEALSSRTYSKGKALPHPALDTELADAYRVPPDRARIPVRVEVVGKSHEAVAQALREEQQALRVEAGTAPGCAVQIVDYQPPIRAGERHLGVTELVVEVELAGLVEVADRMDRLDGCTAAADRRVRQEEEGGETRRVGAGAPVLSVDDPQQHYEAVVQREVARFAAAAATGGAPQLHPEDLRCVPHGEVEMKQRTVSGVELVVRVDCRIEGRPPVEG